MVKAISFDFWESLFGFVSEDVLSRVRGERTKLLAELLNRPVDEVDRYYTEAAVELSQWRERTGFEFSVRDLMSRFLQKANAPEELVDRCCEIFTEAIRKHFPGPNPGAADVVKELHSMGLKLAITSNTIHGTLEEELLKEWGLDRYFCVKALSCRLGVRKPRREIFSWVALRLGVNPSSVLHIGDDPEADVEGALKAGFWSGYYVKPGKSPVDKAHIKVTHWSQLPQLIGELM